jgi:hypothetical protein
VLADRDPEDARKILDPVLEHMMHAVHRYEGTVNQVMGDGIMALFGAPIAHEDHAVRACYAALRMQESVNRYAEEARRVHAVTVQIRVGLNSGDVVVRAIGSDLHVDYTAVGQTPTSLPAWSRRRHPAQSCSPPPPSSSQKATFKSRRGARSRSRACQAPWRSSPLTGASGQRTRLKAAAGRGLTRFVGRDSEMRLVDTESVVGI